jgi:hypothetical protein
MSLYTPFSHFFCRRPIKRVLLCAFVLCAIFDIPHVLRCPVNLADESPHPTQQSERIYIASILWNDEAILHGHWVNAILDLAKVLGQEHVFVSAYESGSWDSSKALLRDLDKTLNAHGIRHNITLSNVTHADVLSLADDNKGPGWINTPRGQRKELRRIPYLSQLRNWALQPLLDLSRQVAKIAASRTRGADGTIDQQRTTITLHE